MISVVIPVYNCERFIEKTIGSLFNQTYKDFEIIIVDDGSTDRTPELIKNKMESSEMPIYYYHQPNRGPSAARNLGLRYAKGEFLSFLDADDYWDNRFLEKMFFALSRSSADIAVCDNYRIELRKGTVISEVVNQRSPILAEKAVLLKEFLVQDLIGGPSRMVCKKSIFDEIGGYDEKLWLYQEWDLWIRFFWLPRKLVHVREPLYFYHVRNDGSNITRRKKVVDVCIEVMRIFKKFQSVILSDVDVRNAYSEHLWDCARRVFYSGPQFFFLSLYFMFQSKKLKFGGRP